MTRKHRPLSKRQREVYDFIKDRIVNRGYGPTVREIGDHVGIKSLNGVICHLLALEKKGFITRHANKARAIELTEAPQKRMSLHMAGQIAAGVPLEAVELDEKIDFSNLFDSEKQYCLKVEGDSLNDEQIAEGDFVVVRRQNQCQNGHIAVVSINGEPACLKRFHKERNRIRLGPANSKRKPTDAKNVKVLGEVVGVLRSY